MLRSLLLRLSESPRLARWVMRNGASRRVAQRFVAGASLDEAVAAARGLNRAGRLVSLDYLGESVASETEARAAGEIYAGLFDRIAAEKLDANVSLKLTQLGLDLGEDLCLELLERIIERAARTNNFVRIDMEGSAYTQRTVDVCKRARAKSPAVGTVLQAYLHRSEQDVRDLTGIGCRIRLCKGAYKEPAEVAFPKKADVDANYVKLMKMLLPSGIYHGIATHDPAMLAATKEFAAANGIRTDQFEFQMLYGIRTDLQEQLVREGFRLRVYIPFGQDWFPYFMRRLAERPANLVFFLRSLFR
ncbi:MAG TPA: proline dehydrogenase family protein [Candidatus Acidoferrales bacterium]|jgi:proline dehydrogenase|nr:proline dehydrogenase family protein [Candidatus Acidoferrales bacterium]